MREGKGESDPGRSLGFSLIPSYLPTPPWRATAGGARSTTVCSTDRREQVREKGFGPTGLRTCDR
jgi:hypothetical protein